MSYAAAEKAMGLEHLVALVATVGSFLMALPAIDCALSKPSPPPLARSLRPPINRPFTGTGRWPP